MRTAFDRRRKTIVGPASATSPASSARSRRARSTSTRRSRACSASRCAAGSSHTSAELADVILDEAEVAVVPGEAFGTPGLLAAVVRARRRRPGRGRRPDRQAGRRRRLSARLTDQVRWVHQAGPGLSRTPLRQRARLAQIATEAGNCARPCRSPADDDPPGVGGDVAAHRGVPRRPSGRITGRLQRGRSLVVGDEVVVVGVGAVRLGGPVDRLPWRPAPRPGPASLSTSCSA